MKPAENVFGWKQLAEDAKKKIQDAQDKRREIRNDFYEEARGFYEETRGFTKLVFAKPLELINQQFEPPQPGEARRLNSADKAFVKSIITVQKDFVMSNLSDKEVDMLVHAMEKIIVTPGENVITQGDVGDYLYVLKEGSIRFIKDGKEVGIAGPGEVFGELALLYDCRRAATVVADGECLLFRVCRSTFRTIQANFILYNDDEARRLLKQSKAFQDLPDDIIREMASYLFKKEFKKGEILSRKGEDFGKVYFIREGRALASGITVNNTDYADIELKPGECFGERAILMGGGALANVECLTDGLLYVLTKERFLHCLEGIDLHEILEKKIDASVLTLSPFFRESDISPMEIMQMAQKLKHIKLEPGEVLATIGEEVEPALYYISTNSKDAGHIEMTKNDGATHTFVSPQPFGFGKDALIATNLDYHVGALYGKKQNLVKLGTEEEVKAAKRNLLERNVVFSQATVKAVGTDTIHLRKLTLEDIHDIIHDPFRLGKDYQNESRNADISHTTLEKKLLLGQGTFGQVWLCRAPSESPYALKIQYKREIIEQHQAAGVIRETGVMRKMHHPFVMGLINAEQDPQCLYMVTEPHLGGELRQQMRNTDRPNLSESDAKFYAACILEGLSYMHRRDYIYRDLKGENVLLDKDGYCVIIDFGFAKHVPDKTFTFCGTPVFIAPEVLLNTGHNKSADLWSFGILIYEMLFGTNPFMDYDDPAIDQRTLFKRIVKASFQRPQKQSALDAYAKTSKNAKDLIKKLLIVKPRKRLGCRGQADLEIRNHPWFSDIDFGKLYRKELTAPWIPKISDPFDSSNFNPKEPKSKAGLKKLKTWEQEKFKDF